jgi:hypothetical protein
MTTTDVLFNGWVNSRKRSGLSTFISVQNMIVAPCENTTGF